MKKTVIIIAVIVLIVGLSIGIYFYVQKKKQVVPTAPTVPVAEPTTTATDTPT